MQGRREKKKNKCENKIETKRMKGDREKKKSLVTRLCAKGGISWAVVRKNM